MIVFNTTFHIDETLQDEFIEYILQEFIPMSTKSGILTSARFARIYGSNKDEGLSFAMEFQVETIELLEKWNKEESNYVYNLLMDKFKEKLVGFSTVLQTIDY
ncbi:MAG TPA: DUF4286 family protein [Fermentimonas caenicola]|jgi:hypothetical protein|uniref:DUF4286 domain-containing protein n=1 Tax=Fermentimonas caenicola TaxID=1562970 RepID=A0A098C184_9BACT|nr:MULTISPECIES: DUF4286 family protein [Lascolabacillus]MBP6174974.1 DUF4286 family protein [Fermentimonas sp.]TAH60306.1 MAG: DUF4286 family protein [Fermentimonas caenicola]MBP7105157.1 DUF4286 family protein [Fermentimonas sp.]MCK9502227.1 DUF4286 family protein [Lascolabacillus sp.]MDD4758955.1 DUF4286 family protein [Lascolabacillus sp.]